MVYSKSFPRYVGKGSYPVWEEIYLDEKEEKEIEEKAQRENLELMRKCMDDARKILVEKQLKDYQSDMVNIAVALFEKRAEHMVYFKDNKCKQKFDSKFK